MRNEGEVLCGGCRRGWDRQGLHRRPGKVAVAPGASRNAQTPVRWPLLSLAHLQPSSTRPQLCSTCSQGLVCFFPSCRQAREDRKGCWRSNSRLQSPRWPFGVQGEGNMRSGGGGGHLRGQGELVRFEGRQHPVVTAWRRFDSGAGEAVAREARAEILQRQGCRGDSGPGGSWACLGELNSHGAQGSGSTQSPSLSFPAPWGGGRPPTLHPHLEVLPTESQAGLWWARAVPLPRALEGAGVGPGPAGLTTALIACPFSSAVSFPSRTASAPGRFAALAGHFGNFAHRKYTHRRVLTEIHKQLSAQPADVTI